jgi:hypothetical protein
MTDSEIVFVRAGSGGNSWISIHVNVAQLVSHLVAVVLVEERQVTKHEVVVLLLVDWHGRLLLEMVTLIERRIRLRHRINLVLNWNLGFLYLVVGGRIKLVDAVRAGWLKVLGWAVYEVVHLSLVD